MVRALLHRLLQRRWLRTRRQSPSGIPVKAIAGCLAAALVTWLAVLQLWPRGHIWPRGAFGPLARLQPSNLNKQIASGAKSAAVSEDVALQAEVQAMFEQIPLDFAPFRKTNITLEMVEQAYCACRLGGFRFQAIKNELFVVGEVHSPQSRHEYIKRQLLDLLRTDSSLPDVDIYFGAFDLPEKCTTEEMEPRCRQRGPHFHHTRTREDDWVILHPDETFGGWPESKISSWAEMQQVLAISAKQHGWEQRKAPLFFAGANLGFQRRNFSFVNWDLYPEMDVRWVNWGDPQTIMPVHDFCQFRHLLHLAGCSWSSRLKYLMLCKSAIVFPQSPFLEFWYRALTPGKNILSVPEIVSPASAIHVQRAAQRLIRDKALAQRLAAAAQATALVTLSVDNVRAYWRRLLHEYAALQTFTPKKHRDAVPLHASITHPVKIAPEERTCTICPHPSWSSFKGPFCRGVDDP